MSAFRIKYFLPKGSTITRIKNSYLAVIGWTEPARTVKYFVFYMFFVYYFHIWWIPVLALYLLFYNWKNKRPTDAQVLLSSVTARSKIILHRRSADKHLSQRQARRRRKKMKMRRKRRNH